MVFGEFVFIVLWLKENKQLCINVYYIIIYNFDGFGTFIVNDFQREDSGFYVCKVENMWGEFICVVELFVFLEDIDMIDVFSKEKFTLEVFKDFLQMSFKGFEVEVFDFKQEVVVFVKDIILKVVLIVEEK